MRLAYADPPYLGCCGLYDHYHPDGLCWDDPFTHGELLRRLADYDGWLLHSSSVALPIILDIAQHARLDGFRIHGVGETVRCVQSERPRRVCVGTRTCEAVPEACRG